MKYLFMGSCDIAGSGDIEGSGTFEMTTEGKQTAMGSTMWVFTCRGWSMDQQIIVDVDVLVLGLS